MVERSLVELEVRQALDCIKNKKNFVVTGGAGSGKTYSLISLINEYSRINKNDSILCITYTNNAVHEIKERCTRDSLHVSTIHEILWQLIKQFQKELKKTLVDLINDDSKKFKIFKMPEGFKKIEISFFDGKEIDYDEYYSMNDEESIVSHDHLIILAEKMFEKYKKLCHILKDTARLILIDEYQDTAPEVIRILLEHIKKSEKDCVAGFFGDSMQSIYDSGIGSIDNSEVKRINKVHNRRNPLSVIQLANKFRTDGLVQKESTDYNAPNMVDGQIVEGQAYFLYSEKDENTSFRSLEIAKEDHKIFNKWRQASETKELWLTHRFNAERAGFESLFILYNKDPLMEIIRKLKNSKDTEFNLTDSFIDLCEANQAIFQNRNRGNLYLNLKKEHKEYLHVLRNENWEFVKGQYINKDSLLSYKFDGISNTYKSESSRDPILRQLDDVYEIIDLYKQNNINALLKKTTFNISSLSDKSNLAKYLAELQNYSDAENIDQILEYAFQNNLVRQSDSYQQYISAEGYYLWNRIKKIEFKEYLRSIEYQKAKLPFATQHSIKGSEYDYVLVVLDNGKWNKYNFEKTFLQKGNEDVQERTRKLLYVCFTRAKKELYVYMELDLESSDGEDILCQAREWFGEDNVIYV